ncbi:hypothetical protein CMV_027180 [Castanea mollissima]|uniref:Histone deacetylase domain-containing protein n=2 Tax=Castanea mollissima TaxID=60419 RepID=A0A8J4QAH1_9ROSI|nr:hypothetical protein CMV_027180 [Castanea mollissima]
MDQASQQGIIFIDGSGVWANICYFHRSRWKERHIGYEEKLLNLDVFAKKGLESLVAAGAGITKVIFVLASRNHLDPPVGFALIIHPGHPPIPKGPTGLCFRKCGHYDAFYDDPDIFIISTHQDGSYPGTGKVDEVGHGDGEGTEIKFAFKIKADIILVSAGFALFGWQK